MKRTFWPRAGRKRRVGCRRDTPQPRTSLRRMSRGCSRTTPGCEEKTKKRKFAEPHDHQSTRYDQIKTKIMNFQTKTAGQRNQVASHGSTPKMLCFSWHCTLIRHDSSTVNSTVCERTALSVPSLFLLDNMSNWMGHSVSGRVATTTHQTWEGHQHVKRRHLIHTVPTLRV